MNAVGTYGRLDVSSSAHGRLAGFSRPCHVGFVTDDITDLVRRHDPDRFLAALFAPPQHRPALLVLCAFNHELARAREVASQPMLALIRLHWWREVVQGARRRHAVAEPLGRAIDEGLLHADDLLAMIDAREAETEPSMPDRAAFDAYVAGYAGGFAVAAGRLLGADAPTLARLRALGTAYGIAGQLGSLAALARQERCQLPLDLLGANGLLPEQVIQRPELAAPVAAELTQDGLRLIARSGGWFPRGLIAAALPAVLARRDLRSGQRRRGLGSTLAVIGAALMGRV